MMKIVLLIGELILSLLISISTGDSFFLILAILLVFTYVCYLLGLMVSKFRTNKTSLVPIDDKKQTEKNNSHKEVSNDNNAIIPEENKQQIKNANQTKPDVKDNKSSANNLHLWQDRHFFPKPLEGNVSKYSLEVFNKTIADANEIGGPEALEMALDIPNHVDKEDKDFVKNFISTSLFGKSFYFHDPYLNEQCDYDIYYWKITSTSQVFFIDMVESGYESSLSHVDQIFNKQINYIEENFAINNYLFEENVPGDKAEKELEAVCDLAYKSGNLIFNKGFSHHIYKYFDINTRHEIDPSDTYQFLTRPDHQVTLFDYLYKNKMHSSNKWDSVDKSLLVSCGTCKNKVTNKLFTKKIYKRQKAALDQFNKKYNKLATIIVSIVENDMQGHIYKSVGKRAKCVIVYTDISDEKFSEFKERGLEVYQGV